MQPVQSPAYSRFKVLASLVVHENKLRKSGEGGGETGVTEVLSDEGSRVFGLKPSNYGVDDVKCQFPVPG